ncbi:MAG: endonuclease III [Planctomycetes bacterium]|nr:endonuclease III [Planctomycetota bacterium]
MYRTLEQTYPDAHCALDHRNAFELLIATILSAQCTDERVNKTTPALFKRYPDAEALADAKQAEVEKLIKSCGFYRNKAKNLIGAATGLVTDFDGRVPRTMDELLSLPGVARKTANVVLGNAFDINKGVVVDTHVGRLAVRLGWTEADSKNAAKIERDLMGLHPRKKWTMLAHLLIWHGRALCTARRPKCEQCPVRRACPQIGVD